MNDTILWGDDSRFELRDSESRWDPNRYRVFDKAGDAEGERERPLCYATSVANGLFIAKALTRLYGEEH